MAQHMSLRLAWHNDGWNGHICKQPCNNPYCVGLHSYPGTLIKDSRDIDFEIQHAGEAIEKHPFHVACALSANAFGKNDIKVSVNPPTWWGGGADPAIIELPASTACTWCYEEMYSKDVAAPEGSGRQYDYDKRRKNAEEYFSQFEENKSLLFYVSGYSNPFSEEENTYVIIGVSRIKKIDRFHFYENLSEENRNKYAGGIVWQKPITSNYPNEGFCLPYWKYMDNEEVLSHIVIKPNNRMPFKYGSRAVPNDDAIEVINQLISSVDYLIEIGDTTEDWEKRKDWLNSVLNELWLARGPYPGLGSLLEHLGLNCLIKRFQSLTSSDDINEFREKLITFLEGDASVFNELSFTDRVMRKLNRSYLRLENSEKELMFNILTRFSITSDQFSAIMNDVMGDHTFITASAEELAENPYLIFEQYQGTDNEDTIPLYKIDNGLITSPEYGIEDLMDEDSPERFRAMCVNELNRLNAHSFGKAETVVADINSLLDRMPEWKRYHFTVKDFKIDTDILEGGLQFRYDDKGELYIYLKSVYEDEQLVKEVISDLAERPDIQLKMAVSAAKFKEKLRSNKADFIEKTGDEHEAILDSQADVCMQIFTKPVCVLSGAAGTGKTTVVKAILNLIERVHGVGTSFQLLAPTGKAAERIKNQTGKKSTTTIHSFLAKYGWLNDNMTLKRSGGIRCSDINTLIIDECSMIDLTLFATLLRAINWNSVQRLILIGDPNQLPPIGRGKVFSDIIDWFKSEDEFSDNIGILTKNIRQLVNRIEGNGTGILDLANIFIQERQSNEDENSASNENSILLKKEKEEIFEKILENGNGDVDKDLSVYFWDNQEELTTLIKKCLAKDMKHLSDDCNIDESVEDLSELWHSAIKDGDSYNPERIQIITPYRGEFYGTDSINQELQVLLNPYWANRVNLDGITYYDKVIQVRNRPASNMAFIYNCNTGKPERAEIYNGEIGLVFPHSFDKENLNRLSRINRFQVEFSNESRKGLMYYYGDSMQGIPEKQEVLDYLELAYAISVHKSQGSEFDYVYIILPKKDSRLLSMELLYTALTRAQKHVTVFLEQDIGTLTTIGHLERSALRKINSSVFKFSPLPDDVFNSRNWFADERKLATLSKYYVRSKSEVIIANMLIDNEIPFEYEKPLYAKDGSMYLPDFTCKFKGEEYYWEHVGRMDLPSYAAHWKKKEAWYNKNFPGKLITTFESNELSKEASEIISKNK